MDADSILDAGFDQNGLHINGQSNAYLKEIAKWTYFLSIVGIIFVGMLILGIVYMMTSISAFMGPEVLTSFITFGIVIMIYIYPITKLFNFSKDTKAALRSNSAEQLSIALGELKSLFKFMGIFTIVILVLYGGLFLFGGAAVLMGLDQGF